MPSTGAPSQASRPAISGDINPLALPFASPLRSSFKFSGSRILVYGAIWISSPDTLQTSYISPRKRIKAQLTHRWGAFHDLGAPVSCFHLAPRMHYLAPRSASPCGTGRESYDFCRPHWSFHTMVFRPFHRLLGAYSRSPSPLLSMYITRVCSSVAETLHVTIGSMHSMRRAYIVRLSGVSASVRGFALLVPARCCSVIDLAIRSSDSFTGRKTGLGKHCSILRIPVRSASLGLYLSVISLAPYTLRFVPTPSLGIRLPAG
ncbi:hypothetical protein R3P38DRAFT_3287519 [Favolaschia claudopus]|uniref:Uncharacterized protein n=1 Tax=Favolaschia claudopus TaxID=2862362 RepID=A0AAW0A0W9_9AGAR